MTIFVCFLGNGRFEVVKSSGFKCINFDFDMNSFAAFWESLGCDKFFLILGGVLFIAHIILLLYRYALLVKKQQRSGRREKVSVIITCSIKAELLKENLVAYLEQDYPSFEVIVVDECSEDDTQEVLSEYQKRYPQ